jgi:hypothetical protein
MDAAVRELTRESEIVRVFDYGSENSSGAEALHLFTFLMYGLKPVPFNIPQGLEGQSGGGQVLA